MAGGLEDLLLGAVERDGLKSSTSLSVLGSPSPPGQIPACRVQPQSLCNAHTNVSELPPSCKCIPWLSPSPGPTLHGITYL